MKRRKTKKTASKSEDIGAQNKGDPYEKLRRRFISRLKNSSCSVFIVEIPANLLPEFGGFRNELFLITVVRWNME